MGRSAYQNLTKQGFKQAYFPGSFADLSKDIGQGGIQIWVLKKKKKISLEDSKAQVPILLTATPFPQSAEKCHIFLELAHVLSTCKATWKWFVYY